MIMDDMHTRRMPFLSIRPSFNSNTEIVVEHTLLASSV